MKSIPRKDSVPPNRELWKGNYPLPVSPAPEEVITLNRFRSERLLSCECGEFNVKYLNNSVKDFVRWANFNKNRLKKWLQLHNEKWIRGEHAARIPRRIAIPIGAYTGVFQASQDSCICA